MNVTIRIMPSSTVKGALIFSAYCGKRFMLTEVKEDEQAGIQAVKDRFPEGSKFRVQRKAEVLVEERNY